MSSETYVGGTAASTSNGTTLTPALPAGYQAGDVFLAITMFSSSADVSIGTPAGWTKQVHYADGATFGQGNVDVFYRVATSASETAPGFSEASGIGYFSVMVLCFRGGVSASPIRAVARTGYATASSTFVAPTLTAGAHDTLVVADLSWTSSAGVSVAPSGMSAGPSTTTAKASAYYKLDMPAGGTGSPTSAMSAAAQGSAVAILLIQTNNNPPNAPTLTSPANNATIDRGITQRFAWTFSDPDAGDSQSKFDLQYRVVGTTPWTTVSSTTPNTFYDFAASTFAAGNYEWQVRTYDSQGLVGPWSSSSFFTAADAPPQPTPTAPTSGSTVNNTATLTWSAPNQTDYQWRRVADNAGAANTSVVYADSGDVVDATTRSVTVAFDTNSRYEHVQVRIKNAGLWSSWADIRVQVSYTPPTVATFTMAADPPTATRTLTITNPAPGSGVPATSYNDVYVRTAASSTVADTYRPYSATGTRIGTQLATNTAFVDRTPAGSPVVYEYRVVSVASNGTTSDSGWVSTA